MGYDVWTLSVAGQVIGWGSQIVGHAIFEKRAPAIETNVFLLFLAPFFSTFEVLNWCGYKENDELKAIQARIDAEIREYHETRESARKT
jgi:uncharacterized membrane protein YGL010W